MNKIRAKEGKVHFSHFSVAVRVRREKEKRETLPSLSLYDLCESVARFLTSQELKFLYATRATRGYQKQRILPKIRAKSLGDLGFRVSGKSKSFIFALRGREPSYSSLFFI